MLEIIQTAIDDLNSAYDGKTIKEKIRGLFSTIHTNGNFAAKYLGGVLAADFVTRKDLYEYFTNGFYAANTFNAEDRTSNKAMSVLLFENYFGNATELYQRYNYDYGPTKKK